MVRVLCGVERGRGEIEMKYHILRLELRRWRPFQYERREKLESGHVFVQLHGPRTTKLRVQRLANGRRL
ncbi:hypothetical protein U1Q18_050911, partial [Sarracenia purpurea var. burkii]